MSSEQLQQFSLELKSAREESNLTLQMLNQKTRIDLKFLQAIEDSNFHIIDEVYVRAFIKSYAKNIGLDEDATLKKYSLAKEGKYVDSENLSSGETDSQSEDEKNIVFTSEYVKTPMAESGASNKLDKRFIIIGITLVIITIIIYFVFLSNNSNTIIKESPTSANQSVTEPKIERFEIIEPEVVSTVESETISDSLVLKIDAISRTWMRIIIDDTDQMEFTLNPSESKTIIGTKKFKLLVGNAGGISLYLNGQVIQLQGKIGDIKNVEIDSSGIRYLKINTESKNGVN